MSTNMELIETKTAGSGGVSNFDFTSIPATYTDLYILCSLRSSISANADDIKIEFNNSSSNFSWRNLYGNGSTVISQNNTNNQIGTIPAASMTASSFGNASIYITNYASANYKSVSGDSVAENNATRGDQAFYATLWSNTAAITSVKLLPSSGTFLEFSSASLYGISNVTSTTKATGGIVSSDGTYNYHMFPYSGTFTPTTAISADVLVVAGGGAGGGYVSAGGAGGLSYQTGRSLTAQNYTVLVGAGGASLTTSAASAGGSGGNSVFDTITSNGGGGGAGFNANNAAAGGSGGGGTYNKTAGGASNQGNTGGATGYGFAGGAGDNSGSVAGTFGGGGGGAGAVGTNANANTGTPGNGGNGRQYLDFANATQTGANNGYYAGGGGGAHDSEFYIGIGGLGGGGNGGTSAGTQKNGLANTGGGGGGINANLYTSGAGGSGIVIIRYAI